jgi:AhpD family alkylhydroperoxidase
MMTREEIYEDIRNTLGLVPTFFTRVPDATLEHDWLNFKSLQLQDTVISIKYKELIGLAAAAAIQCPYCVFYHTEVAKFFGATDAEVEESVRMGMQTAGWSTFITGTGQELDAFKAELRQALEYVRQQQDKKAA